MGRILFWMGLAVIIWAVIVLGRRRREAAERAMRQRAREEAKEAQAAMPVPMKTCPVCGAHFHDSPVLRTVFPSHTKSQIAPLLMSPLTHTRFISPW